MRKSVLIVEDSKPQLEMLRQLVLEVDPAAEVYMAEDIRTAYTILIENTIDTFLVDIILDTTRPGDTSGIRLVEKIRTIPKYMFVPVLFITSLEDTSHYAYTDLNCLGYLEKPFLPEGVKEILEKALHFSTERDRDATCCFRKDGILYPVKVRDILYMESSGHAICIHIKKKGSLTIPYRTCKQILKEADSDRLIQCSRSTIVNKDYIQNIDIPNKYITLEDVTDKISIGHTYKKKILAEFGYGD